MTGHEEWLNRPTKGGYETPPALFTSICRFLLAMTALTTSACFIQTNPAKSDATNSLTLPLNSSIQLVNDKLVLHERGSQGTSVTIYDAATLTRIANIERQFDYINFSYGENPSLVLVDIQGEEILKLTAINMEGTILFEKNLFIDGELFPSPNGQYFHTKVSALNANDLVVMNADGVELFTNRKQSDGSSMFDASAFSDSVIAFFGSTEMRFFEVPSGKLLAIVNMEKTKLEGYQREPKARVCDAGGGMLVCWGDRRALINEALETQWTQTSKNYFLNAAFSPDSRFIAIYESQKQDYKITLHDAKTGTAIWSERFKSSRVEATSRHRDIRFTYDYLSVMVPQGYYVVEGVLNDQTRTELFHFDASQGTLISRRSVKGVLYMMQTEQTNLFFHIDPANPTKLQVTR